jgi:hypothetical protein
VLISVFFWHSGATGYASREHTKGHTQSAADNEYAQADWAEGGDHYFEQLKEAFRKGGIEVPLTYNDPGQDKTFVNGTVSIATTHRSIVR